MPRMSGPQRIRCLPTVRVRACGGGGAPAVSAPVAAFSGTPLTGTAPYTVTFTDVSTNTPTAWDWDFGDGGTSTLQNPTHEYTVAGTYTVTLIATNAGGSDIEEKVAYVAVSAPAFSPADISGLLLWLDAAEGTFQTVGGAAATADGDPVGSWLDQSGEGNNASQATSAKRFTLKTNIQNSLPAMLLDGTDDVLNVDFTGAIGTAIRAGEFTLFIVAKTTTVGVGQAALSNNNGGTPAILWYLLAGVGKCRGYGGVSNVYSSDATTNWSASDFQIRGYTESASNGLRQWLNGAADGSSAHLDYNIADTLLQIGAINNTIAPWNGYICELLIYDADLSSGDRDDVFDYLSTKWGI